MNEFRIELLNFQTSVKNELSKIREYMKTELIKINLAVDKIFESLESIKNSERKFDYKAKEKVDLLKAWNFPIKTCYQLEELNKNIRENKEFKIQLVLLLFASVCFNEKK